MKRHLHTAFQPQVMRTAMRFALIVGPVLILINHGDALYRQSMDEAAWWKSLLTVLVPYIVSTLSSISAYHSCQDRRDHPGS